MKYLVKVKRKIDPDLYGPYSGRFIQNHFKNVCGIDNFAQFADELSRKCKGMYSNYCVNKCPFSLKDSEGSVKGCSFSATADVEVVPVPDSGNTNGASKYKNFAKELTLLRMSCMHEKSLPARSCNSCTLLHSYGLCLCGGRNLEISRKDTE